MMPGYKKSIVNFIASRVKREIWKEIFEASRVLLPSLKLELPWSLRRSNYFNTLSFSDKLDQSHHPVGEGSSEKSDLSILCIPDWWLWIVFLAWTTSSSERDFVESRQDFHGFSV